MPVLGALSATDLIAPAALVPDQRFSLSPEQEIALAYGALVAKDRLASVVAPKDRVSLVSEGGTAPVLGAVMTSERLPSAEVFKSKRLAAAADGDNVFTSTISVPLACWRACCPALAEVDSADCLLSEDLPLSWL